MDPKEPTISPPDRAADTASYVESPVPDTTVSTPQAPGPAAAETLPSPSTPRYRLVRFHARGGLGQVSVALDQELDREVALKEIQDRYARDPESRARFLLEARITGRLEHPGIVPVYGLGAYPDGRPFYAMRFIQGESLHDALHRFHRDDRPPAAGGERALEFRQLLGRFVAVCNAVAYAHSCGVLHRDLKPQNIMLGRYGETLVVDWGVARLLGRNEDRPAAGLETLPESGGSGTRTGAAVGTPPYMSPEQAAGRWDVVGPASDVYSLGATLYTLLTGRLPFQGRDVAEVLARVRRGDFPLPRQVRPAVPAALDAACLKAMALRPEDRYATALDLAADVEHWLADEPVSAYREPWSARAARWLKRHRPLVAGAAALLVSATVFLAVLAVLADRARRQSDQDRAAVAEQYDRAERERARAENNAQLARHNEARARAGETRAVANAKLATANARRARANLGKAQDAIERMLNRVGDERLAYVPQFDRERLEILRDALALQKELLDANATEPAARLEAARAHARTGDLLHLLGRDDEAEKAYDDAVRGAKALVAEHPADPDYRRALARSHGQLGLLCWKYPGDPRRSAKAEDAFREALRGWQDLVGRPARTVDDEAQLAMTWYRLAMLYENGKPPRYHDADEAFGRTLRLQKDLVHKAVGVWEYRGTLGSIDMSAGYFYMRTGRLAEAEAAYKEGVALFEELAPAHPRVVKYQEELAFGWHNLGYIYVRTNRAGAAEEAQEKALPPTERLAEAHPYVPKYQADLVRTLGQRARLHELHGRWAEAEASYDKALRACRRLTEGHPTDTSYAADLAQVCTGLGLLWLRRDQPARARPVFEEARGVLERVTRARPKESAAAGLGLALGGTYVNLGNCLEKVRPGEGVALFTKAVPVLEAVRKERPEDGTVRQFLRNAHMARAMAEARLGRHRAAADDWAEAAGLEAGPARAWFRRQRAVALAHAGDHAAAVAEAEAQAGQAGSGDWLYDLACVYSLSRAAAKEQPALAERYGARAVELLRRAASTGFFDDPAHRAHLKADPDLAPLRERADYRRFLRELGEHGQRT